MKDQTNWHEVALRENETAIIFKNASEQGTFLHALFFGTIESGKGSTGIYTELYRLSGENRLRAVSLMFVAPENRLHALIFGTVTESDMPLGGRFTTEVNCNLDPYAIFEIDVQIKQEISELGDWQISSASAQLKKNKPKFFDCDLQACSWPSEHLNLLVNSDFHPTNHCVCPNCLGQGSLITMAIPKEDWESGLTGYALFSCNRTNGRIACGVCNGVGAEYVPWYEAENPEKAGSKLVSGTGVIGFR